MKKDGRFYFANLGVDVGRCVSALQKGNRELCEEHLLEAYRTLEFLHQAQRPEAYEEGSLLLRELVYAHEDGRLSEFNDQINELIAEYSPLV